MKKISLSTPSVKSTQIFKDSCCSSYCTKYDCLMSITGCVLFYVLWMSFSQKPRQVPLTRAVNVWCFVLRHILRAFWEIVKTEVVSRKKTNKFGDQHKNLYTFYFYNTSNKSCQCSALLPNISWWQRPSSVSNLCSLEVVWKSSESYSSSFCISVFLSFCPS